MDGPGLAERTAAPTVQRTSSPQAAIEGTGTSKLHRSTRRQYASAQSAQEVFEQLDEDRDGVIDLADTQGHLARNLQDEIELKRIK